jgi:hypothetical protein
MVARRNNSHSTKKVRIWGAWAFLALRTTTPYSHYPKGANVGTTDTTSARLSADSGTRLLRYVLWKKSFASLQQFSGAKDRHGFCGEQFVLLEPPRLKLLLEARTSAASLLNMLRVRSHARICCSVTGLNPSNGGILTWVCIYGCYARCFSPDSARSSSLSVVRSISHPYLTHTEL